MAGKGNIPLPSLPPTAYSQNYGLGLYENHHSWSHEYVFGVGPVFQLKKDRDLLEGVKQSQKKKKNYEGPEASPL